MVAPWCEHCATMDRTTYTRAEVTRLVRDRFVAVRVDTDRRPDINERYNLGGWPTTAFLTPDGKVFGGGTFIEAQRMASVLADVAEAFAHRRTEIAARTNVPREEERASLPNHGEGRTDVEPLAWLSSRLLELSDQDEGGFGTGPKFPHVPALTLALERYNDTRDPSLRTLVTRSLDALTALCDPDGGGFFRYASNRDWTRPYTAKLLADNADLIRLYLDAGETLGDQRYVEVAQRTLAWVQRVLARPNGFAASQAADSAYYERVSAGGRVLLTMPRVDETAYADSNAAMIAAKQMTPPPISAPLSNAT